MSMYQSASRPELSVTRPWTTASSTISSSNRSRSGEAPAPFQGPAPRDEGWGGTGSFSMAFDPTGGQDRPMRPSRHRLAAVGATVATAVAGGFLTDPTSAWFQALRKPQWYPPPATFGIVWTGLYAGMAWAGGEVLERTDDRRAFARAAALNLVLNAGWTPVFFRAHRPALAALESAVLTASTADLIRRPGRVSPVA